VILCGVLGAAAIAWVIAYDCLKEDQQRAALAIAFQALVDTLLIAILAVEMALKAADKSATNDYKKLCRVGPEFERLDDSDWGILSFGAGAATLGAILAPLEAIGNE
jgi:hypothetical protein